MPHVIVRAAEAQLVGREAELVAGLTDAVVDVYGEWVRDQAVVVLVAVPAGRWGIAGRIIDTPPPMVEFGINERALARDDATRSSPGSPPGSPTAWPGCSARRTGRACSSSSGRSTPTGPRSVGRSSPRADQVRTARRSSSSVVGPSGTSRTGMPQSCW